MKAIKKFIITGTSQGIGHALAVQLLQDEQAHVVGISRRCTIEHERYTHHSLELSDANEVMNFELPILGNEAEIYLINNAGWIGEIAPLGQLDHSAIQECITINLTSPALLMNQFFSKVASLKNARKVIVNISSGAAKHPIKSWSSYCTSKAGLDMLTRVAIEEHPEIETYAIAPGVVDTPMQKTIRHTKPELFSDVSRFQAYFENGDLTSPEAVALKIIHLINNPTLIPQKLFSLRDIQ